MMAFHLLDSTAQKHSQHITWDLIVVKYKTKNTHYIVKVSKQSGKSLIPNHPFGAYILA